MNVILCCSKMSLRERWFYPLVDHYTVYQAVALQELSILVKNRISFDVYAQPPAQIWVHRMSRTPLTPAWFGR